MDDDDVYDVGPTSSEIVTDINTLKQRFEQKPAPFVKPKPAVKPKQLSLGSAGNKVPLLPSKGKSPSDVKTPPPILPKSSQVAGIANPLKLPKKAAPVPGENKPVDRPVTILQKRISGKPSKVLQSIKDAGTVVGIDGKIYKRLPKPTPSSSGPAPKKPKRPAHIVLPEYAGDCHFLAVLLYICKMLV